MFKITLKLKRVIYFYFSKGVTVHFSVEYVLAILLWWLRIRQKKEYEITESINLTYKRQYAGKQTSVILSCCPIRVDISL